MKNNNYKPGKRITLLFGVLIISLIVFTSMLVAQAYYPRYFDQFVGLFLFNEPEHNQTVPDSTTRIEAGFEFRKIDQKSTQKENKHKLELEYYNQAIEKSPDDASLYSGKADAYYNLGDKDKAIQAVEEGLNQNPNNELLKSKLDVLNKEWFNDPDEEMPRG